MNRISHHKNIVAAACAVGLAAVLTLGVGQPAGAATASTLFVGGGGIAEIDDAGAVVVEGPALVQDKHLRNMLDASIRATMAPTDGGLPEIGECKAASATFVVEGERDADMTLTSDGTVCRIQNANFPAIVMVKFTGVHQVITAKRPQLRGIEGTMSITITSGGFTSLHANSFVPSP